MTSNTTARDVFMYLLLVIVVGMSAMNLGTLLFQYVNIYVPDSSLQQCFASSCVQAIRWALASLIIVFPVLLWVWRFLQRDCIQYPEKLDSRVRRWILYFLLFVSGVVLIGDLVSLVYSWLQGDFTVQFVLKVLIIAYVAGSIFFYFLRALNPSSGVGSKIVGWVAIGVTTVTLVVGFISSGSPFQARLERLDNQRVQDLQNIQNQIVYSHWSAKQSLPGTLSDLNDSISGYVVPVDPQSKVSYEYTKKGDTSFELCAVFATELRVDTSLNRISYPVGANSAEGNWFHGVGRTCFERSIDTQLYPPKTK